MSCVSVCLNENGTVSVGSESGRCWYTLLPGESVAVEGLRVTAPPLRGSLIRVEIEKGSSPA